MSNETAAILGTPIDLNDPRQIDEKGRVAPELMPDRALLVEIVHNQRAANDAIEQFIESMAKNPMLKMLAGKFGA